MKKCIALFFFVALLMPLWAQRKSVAILETYCKEGNIPGAYLLMIGSNIETGIVNNKGYTAYNRAQVEALMAEHSFQRSGLVKDDEIRRLGQMAGVDYVLVSEAVLVEKQMFVTAKVLNVESGRYEMSDNELMDYNPSAIQVGCQNLAAKLLNGGSAPQQIRAQASNPVSNSNSQPTVVSGRDVGLPQPNRDIVVKSGLIGYWNFDGGNADDATDNGYDANLVGNPKFITESPNGYGKALQLQGGRGQIMMVPFNIIPASFTICFWVKDFSAGLFFAEPSGRGLGVRSDGTIAMINHDAGFFKAGYFDYNARDIQSSGWHHISFSVASSGNGYNGNIYRLYVDGRKVDEQTRTYWYMPSKFGFGGSLRHGQTVNAPGMSFKLDNVRLYDHVLTLSEIKEIYNSEK